jgi:hypothetical protein
MRQGIQVLFAELGEAACLALCICELGRPGIAEGEALELILEGMERGFIDYDEANRDNPDNCFVSDRDSFMALVTGTTGWKSTKETPDYLPAIGERIIEYWEWTERLKDRLVIHTHFKLKGWDPYPASRTVRFGRKAGLRVFRRAAAESAARTAIPFTRLAKAA